MDLQHIIFPPLNRIFNNFVSSTLVVYLTKIVSFYKNVIKTKTNKDFKITKYYCFNTLILFRTFYIYIVP